MIPAVSIVVPVYNAVEYIDASIKSILAQTWRDFELLVSDNCSNDGTWEKLQRYSGDPRVRLTRHVSTIPALDNFNYVTRLARGEFIKMVCADDVLYPDNVAVLVGELNSHPLAVLAVSSKDVIDATGTVIIRNRGLAGLRGEIVGIQAIRRSVLAGTNIYGEPPSALFRRRALNAAGGWDCRFPLIEDLATYSAVLLQTKGNLLAIPRPLWAFRVSASPSSEKTGIRNQAGQAANFFRTLAMEHPGLLDRRQLLIGVGLAHLNAAARHVLYHRIDQRMRSVDQ